MSNIRNKYDKYDESQGMADEGNEFSGELAKAKAQHQDQFSVDGKTYPVKEAAKWRDPKHKDKLYTQEPRSDEDDYYGDEDYYNPKPDDYPGAKNLKSGGEYDHNDPLKKGFGRGGHDTLDHGKRKGMPSRNHITSLKGSIKAAHGTHAEPNLPEDGIPMTAKQKSFAKLAPPADKITFADKIAGAKKEVDEMLGDVAAEAIKGALSSKQKQLDKNHNGKLDATDFAMLRKGGKKQVADEGWDEMEKDVKSRLSAPKVGSVTHGHKHDIEHTATGRRVTRRTDDQGISVGADDASDAQPDKRGRGRPKGAAKGPERVTANATKHKGGRKQADEEFDPADRGEYDQEGSMAKDDIKTIVRHAQSLAKILGDNDNLPEWVQSKLAKIEEMMSSVDDYMQNQKSGGKDTELDEKAVSKKQQRFMGMVHATQKGEKAPSKEVAKVAKEMPKKAAKDFASTKQKGLPEKAPKKDAKSEAPNKKEKTEEAGGTGTPTASSGFSYGKGIYDSMNRELETMIRESMNVSMNMNSDAHGGPEKSLTVTATDDDAMKLGELLKNAGLGGDRPNVEHGAEDLADQIRSAVDGHDHGEHSEEPCPDCGQSPCGCKSVDEAYGDTDETLNQPDWPTNTEHAQDNLGYAGGLNKPKIDVNGNGQTTVPNQAVHTQDEDALHRLREMAGITQEGKVVDALKAGAKAVGKAIAGKNDDELLSKLEKETGGKRPEKKDDKKMEESIFSLTNQWKQYKAQ
jgi:hypothetical protein